MWNQNGIAPNQFCYNSILQTYAKDGDYQNALGILKEMQELAQYGNKSVKPNGVDYSTCIAALASNSRTDSSIMDLAYSLFFAAKKCSKSEGRKSSTNEAILTNMFTVLANCNVGNKARHVRDIVQHGEEMKLVLNVRNYNTLLTALATECGDIEAKSEAYQMAKQSFFSRMEGSRMNYDSRTFLNILLCCQNLLQENNEKQQIFEQIFKICCEAGLVTKKVFSLFKRVVPNSYLLNGVKLQGNSLNYDCVPTKWKIHVEKGSRK
jgi:pentatricopeptide repeat protein